MEIGIVRATDNYGDPIPGFNLERSNGSFLSNKSGTARLTFTTRRAADKFRTRYIRQQRDRAARNVMGAMALDRFANDPTNRVPLESVEA